MGILGGDRKAKNTGARYEAPLTWVLWLILAAAGAALVFVLKTALLPFLVAFVLAYVFAPFVDLLERRTRLPRPAGTALVFVAMATLGAALLLGLLPVLERQIMSLVARLPAAVAHLKEVGLPFLAGHLDTLPLPQTAGAWLEALSDGLGTVGPDLLKKTGGAIKWAASGTWGAIVWTLSAAIVPILTFYLMMDFHRVSGWLLDRIPGARHDWAKERLARTDRMLGEFLRSQLLVGLILSGLYAVGLTLAGVEAALPIALIAGIGNMVPYLGFVLGLSLSLLVSLLTHFDLIHLFYVVLVFGVVQFLEGFLISPKIVGERVGLHPIAIIFALFVGGEAFGFLGVLLGVPAAIGVKALIEAEAPPPSG
ncbi:MAG: AI-2E family transporter [Leptospirillia bacterium]